MTTFKLFYKKERHNFEAIGTFWGSLSISLSAYVRVPLSTTGAVVMIRMPKNLGFFLYQKMVGTEIEIGYSSNIAKKWGKSVV